MSELTREQMEMLIREYGSECASAAHDCASWIDHVARDRAEKNVMDAINLLFNRLEGVTTVTNQ